MREPFQWLARPRLMPTGRVERVVLVFVEGEVMVREVSLPRRKVLEVGRGRESSRVPDWEVGPLAERMVAVVVVGVVVEAVVVVEVVPKAMGSISARSSLYWTWAPQEAPVGEGAGPVRGMNQALLSRAEAVVMGMPLASMRETVSTEGAAVVCDSVSRVSWAVVKGVRARRRKGRMDVWERGAAMLCVCRCCRFVVKKKEDRRGRWM